VGCRGDDPGKPGGGADSDPWVSPDVSERLGPGEVRAGIVADGAALFGGTSAEGREGDVKIYNDRVQFIVQAARPGDYYEDAAGGVIDADVVRPEGEPGRDLIDELWVMVGLGRILAATEVEVLNDGTDGQPAVVQVRGPGAPLTLITGALEQPGFVPALSVDLVTTYTLAPDSHLMKAETLVTWNDATTPIQVGDVAMVGLEVADALLPGRGLSDGEGTPTGAWVGLMGRQNEVAFAIFPEGGNFVQDIVGTLLGEIGPVMAGFEASAPLSSGQTRTFVRWYGVGPDLATLTSARQQALGGGVEVGGEVTAGGAPLAGARVHVMDGAGLETVAVTGEDGRWTALVGGEGRSWAATGRGHAEIVDLPSGAAWIAPYAHEVPAGADRGTLEVGASGAPFAEGYGASAAAAPGDTVALTPPGAVRVVVADGGPAQIRVDFAAGDPAPGDRALVPARPGGAMAQGYARDGELVLPVEPGDYLVTVHRGLRYGAVTEAISVGSGEEVVVDAALPLQVSPAGFLTADPHSHAAPSGDGDIGMAQRLLSHAAHGVQIHVGTDHDHVADYRPLLEPLGLRPWMTSMVADEVSPVLRGHVNVYPLEQVPDQPNMGAPRWWDGITTTDAFYQELQARAGDNGVVQVNHPTGSSGMFTQGAYAPATGTVGDPDRFSEAFDAMEVLNDGSYEEFLPYYLDLTARGYAPTPTGVSDAHGYRNGAGANLTWVPLEAAAPADVTPAAFGAAMRAGQVVVSRGPFLDLRVDGAWAPGGTFTGSPTLTVDVRAADWVVVDTLELYRDGALVDTLPYAGSPVELELSGAADAVYVVVGKGSTPMAPVWPGITPWALGAAIRVDRAGDGWTPPLPPLAFGG
jgi:hypothetical protein